MCGRSWGAAAQLSDRRYVLVRYLDHPGQHMVDGIIRRVTIVLFRLPISFAVGGTRHQRDQSALGGGFPVMLPSPPRKPCWLIDEARLAPSAAGIDAHLHGLHVGIARPSGPEDPKGASRLDDLMQARPRDQALYAHIH